MQGDEIVLEVCGKADDLLKVFSSDVDKLPAFLVRVNLRKRDRCLEG